MKGLSNLPTHRRSEVTQARLEGEEESLDPDPWTSSGSQGPSPVRSAPGPPLITSLQTNQEHRNARPRDPLNHSIIHQDAINPNHIYQYAIHNDNSNTVYQDPVSHNMVYQDPINHNTVYQDPVSHNMVYQDPVSPNMVYQDPVNHNNVYQDPINHNTVYQDPVSHNMEYQDPINQNTIYQDPINHKTVYHHPINPNSVYQDPSNRNIIYQDPLNHNTIYQEPINQDPINHNIYQEPINHENPNPIYHNPVCQEQVSQDSVAFLYQDLSGNSYTAVRRSALWPTRYRSRLLPGENQPLDVGLLRRVKEVLEGVEPRTAAQHITRADCMVAGIVEVRVEDQRRMGVASGVELLTLAHGHQLRLDLLERYQTMSVVLAVFILGCTGSPEERAALLHKAIQIAAQLKSSMGNMFGFSAVMRALELPQVARLKQTWTVLRQRYTECSVLYQHNLRPFLKALDQGKGLREQAEVSEVFQTDFQTRLLWGSGGAGQDPAQRYAKYHSVLTTLSHHLEPPRHLPPGAPQTLTPWSPPDTDPLSPPDTDSLEPPRH
ncbi:uncharacterized protein LOC115545071 isoform X2 [Gadus morhua]|uniref:uncharacterized protein LOC115545071 isoform X2 n=1 Tax=Gadus morhua TaxID=8049 RepID=UPI0011B3FB77|nr:SH2 domain-containing protein 3C isoform X2 [Gadus morhua]